MDKKTNNASSTPDSFHFQLIPLYFKTQHAYAKNIKPNTTYRLSLHKGIQKAEQMAQPIKAKLVGGKIIFDKTLLNFNLPLYSPARNIQFTLKILETKPNQQETEIALHKIKSGDYIRQFKNDNLTHSKEEAMLLDSFSLVFDLFVHSSKIELQKIVNEHLQKSKIQSRSSLLDKKSMRTPRKNEASSEVLSQSEVSDNNSLNRNSGAFASKRKLMRKRGHDGKFRSKHGSRQVSEVGSSRSCSSKKSFGPFPHNQQNQHYVKSPKKVSPPKVDDSSNIKSDVKSGKRQNLVTIGRQESEIQNGKNKNNTPTKITRIQSNRQRSESAKKPQRSNILQINTPITDRKGKVNLKAELHQLEITSKQNMFDIKNKTQAPSPPITRIERQRQSEKPVSKKIASNLPTKVSTTPAHSAEVNQQVESAVDQPISNPTLQQNQKFNLQKQKEKIQTKKEGQKEQSDNFSQRQDRKISVVQVKQIPVQEVQKQEQRRMKASVRLPSAPTFQLEGQDQATQEFDSMKDKIFYVVFVIISAILFWNAVTPSRKV